MRKFLLVVAVLLALPGLVLASPGALDKFGGHTDHKTGQYHFHKLDGRKLAEPLPGEDPNKNGGKIVYTGTPKYADEQPKAEKKSAKKAAKAEPAKAEPAKAVTAAPAPAAAATPTKAEKKAAKKAAKAAKKAAAAGVSGTAK